MYLKQRCAAGNLVALQLRLGERLCKCWIDWPCNSEVDALIERQSAEIDSATRKQMVWQIEHKLIEDAVRPIISFMRQGTCWQSEVKGLTLMEQYLQQLAHGGGVARPMT